MARKPPAKRKATEGRAYQKPEKLTPFTLIALLRRMREDRELPLGDDKRRQLSATVTELETAFFARPDKKETPEVDLEQVLNTWLAQAK